MGSRDGDSVKWRRIGPQTLVLTVQDDAKGIHTTADVYKVPAHTSCGIPLSELDWVPAIWMKIEDVDCPDCKVHVAAAILRREPG